MKYSQDLKDLAVKKVVDGQAIVTVSKELKIPRQSINNWYQRFLAVGHCKNKKSPGAKPRVTEEALIEFFDKNPNATQGDAAEHFSMTQGGIQYWCKKIGLSFKKKFFALMPPTRKNVGNIMRHWKKFRQGSACTSTKAAYKSI
jgi:transposase